MDADGVSDLPPVPPRMSLWKTRTEVAQWTIVWISQLPPKDDN